MSDTEPLDPLVDMVQDECPTCGAYMLNPDLHRIWHVAILEEARSYRDPPRYGG